MCEESPVGIPSRSGACLRAHHPLRKQVPTCTCASLEAGPCSARVLPVLMGTMCFCRDQQPQSTTGGPPEGPQAQMFSLPMLQPELRPESLQSVLSPIW